MDIKTLIAVASGKIPHNYQSGLCPDELQQDSRDPDCPACKILIEAATEHDAMERELRAAETRLHDVATHCATVEAELAEIKRRTCVAVTCNHVARMERAEARVTAHIDEAVEAEREACAKVCEQQIRRAGDEMTFYTAVGQCAAAIRTRSIQPARGADGE